MSLTWLQTPGGRFSHDMAQVKLLPRPMYSWGWLREGVVGGM